MSREIDSGYAWFRLGISVLLSTLGGVGMWSVVVALPSVQAEFGAARGEASLPFTLTTIGFGVGGVVMGRLSDRVGIVAPVLIGAGVWAVDRSVRQRIDLRAVDGGCVEVVRTPPGHRRRHLRLR
jgi:hypothetical protein